VRESIEEQLANVGLGNGVTAIDAFVNQLLEEIAEKEVDGVSGRKIVDRVEERDGLVILRMLALQAIEVVLTEGIMTTRGERAATMPAGIGVLTALIVRGSSTDTGHEFGMGKTFLRVA
jgi:hypothetical protein